MSGDAWIFDICLRFGARPPVSGCRESGWHFPGGWQQGKWSRQWN